MPFTYQTEQWLPYPIESVFAFFADPRNLPALMPTWQRTRLEAVSLQPPSSTDTNMAGRDSQIAISFRPFPGSPLRLSWTAEIAAFARNSYFTDEQITGPFALWEHTHRFRSGLEAGLDGTFVVDLVKYSLPLGLLGRLAHALVLRKQIQRTFLFRQQRAAELIARQFTVRPSASAPARADARAAS